MVRDFVFHLCLGMRQWMGLITVIVFGPVSKKSQSFLGLFQLPQFPLYLCNAKVLCHPLGFSCIINTLKDHSKQADCSLTTGFSVLKSP